jgi:hypothetical protein
MSAAQFMASPSSTDVSSTGVPLVVVMMGSIVTRGPGDDLRPPGPWCTQNLLGAAVNANICTHCFPVWG